MRAATIPEYIQAAPAAGQPHLLQLYALLKRVAPQAEEAIKWGNPFFIEPRFLFAFSAHKTTANFLQIPYNVPLPEDLIRRIAEYRVRAVAARNDDAFW